MAKRRRFNPGNWGLAARLARRELRGGLRGFGIFLACLILGVAAIAGVRSLASGLLDGLAADGRRILGGDIAIEREMQPATPGQVTAMQQQSVEIARQIKGRTMARVPGEGERATLVELKAVESNYPLYGKIELGSGADLHRQLAQRDGQWGAVVAPNLMARLDLALGDRLRVGEASFTIRDTITEEPDRVSGGGFLFGPRVMIAHDAVPATGLTGRGTQMEFEYRLRLAPGSNVAAQAEALKGIADTDWQVRPYTDAAPGLATFIERLSLFLTLVGLTALLVGGVGVGNAVRAFLGGRMPTIATLKCLGAPARLIFRLYLLQILALAVLAVAIGLALGAVLPVAAGAVLAELLPIEARFAVYPEALAVAAAAGLLVAFVFSVWPLARARDVAAGALFRALIAPPGRWPRPIYWLALVAGAGALAALAILTARDQEFAIWFTGGAVATLILFRLAGWAVAALAQRVPRPRRPSLRLAVANLYRPGAPTGAVVLSLGLGLSVLTGIALIEGNLSRQIRDELPETAPAFFFIDIQTDQRAAFTETVADFPDAQLLRQVPVVRAAITGLRGMSPDAARQDDDQAWLTQGDRRVTYRAEKGPDMKLAAGTWWPADYSGPPLVSVEAEAARAHGLAVGDQMTFRVAGREITAEIANLRQLDWAELSLNFAVIFSPGVIEAAPQTHVATVAVPPERELDLQAAVIERFDNVTAVRVREALQAANDLLAKLAAAVRAVAAVTLVAGTLVLAGAIASGHHRRVYDAVVLKVVGATRWTILRALSLEYGLLGAVTAALAVGVGAVVSWGVMTQVMGLSWTFLPGLAIVTVVACALVTFALGLVGTWRALSQPAAGLLRNE